MGNKDYSRNQRVAFLVQKELAKIILTSVSDPRVQMVTLSEIKLSKDLKHAHVYVSVMAEEDGLTVIEVLNHASSFIRRQLAANLNLRATPKLNFIYDETCVRAARINQKINDLSPTSES